MKSKKFFPALAVILLVILGTLLFWNKGKKALYIVSECWVFDTEGKLIRAVNQDQQCLFLKDGSTISFNHKFLTRTDAHGKVVWQKSGFYHHSIQLLKNQTEFVVLNSEPDDETKKIRISRIEKWTINGELAAFWTYKNNVDGFFNFLQRSKEKVKISQEVREMYPFDFEFEHTNFIQEIPENALSEKNPAFKEGNLLVSFGYIVNRIAIFDKDTLKPIWFLKYPQDSIIGGFHSPQVLKSGKIILYVNYAYPGSANAVNRSSIVEIDPITYQTNVIFPQGNEDFYMHVDGGVRVINNNEYLFNGELNHKYLVIKADRQGKIISQFSHMQRSQEVRYEDLTEYLEKVPQ